MNSPILPTRQAFELVRKAVRDAARAAWTELRQTYPTETFYYYRLWTPVPARTPFPQASSHERLARVAAKYAIEYAERGWKKISADDLRWSFDAAYDGFGYDKHFGDVDELFETFGDPYERPEAVSDALWDAIVGAMADLDREGFFGTGAERDKVVINVITGDEEAKWIVARARTLNPLSALAQYERDEGQ